MLFRISGPGRNVPITTLGPWQNAADRRMSSRFPTYRPCELRVGEQATSGHLLDLSMDGVAIEVVAWEGERFVLHVDANERRIEIPCESVGAQQTAGQLMVVRARFDGLTVAEGLAVMELSELVRTDFEAAQARLVSSRRRPTRSLRAS